MPKGRTYDYDYECEKCHTIYQKTYFVKSPLCDSCKYPKPKLKLPKYDHIINEPRNQGFTYREYRKKVKNNA